MLRYLGRASHELEANFQSALVAARREHIDLCVVEKVFHGGLDAANQFFDITFGSVDIEFNAAVGFIANEAMNSQMASFPNGGRAKANALHVT